MESGEKPEKRFRPKVDPEKYGGWVVVNRYVEEMIQIGDVFIAISKISSPQSAKIAILAPKSVLVSRLKKP